MIYLNVAGLSPFNPEVQQEIRATLKQFERLLYSDEGIHYYRETLQRCRQALADWLRIEDENSVAFVPNATTASSLVLSRINWKPGDHILTTTHENSTVLKEILGLQAREVHIQTLDPKSPDELETQIKQYFHSKQVRAILISHVSHIDGRIFPIERISQITQNDQVLLIVDGAQAVGHIPIHFHEWQPDAYFFPGHKWCAGPLGTGALLLGKQFVERNERDRNSGKGNSQPLWLDFELGTQNIGLIAGLAKACTLKQQAQLEPPPHVGYREKWKTCLQAQRGLRILEWDGSHSPSIISFTCMDSESEEFMRRTASTHSLSWKSFSHPSQLSNLSIRLSWSVSTSQEELSSALNFFPTR